IRSIRNSCRCPTHSLSEHSSMELTPAVTSQTWHSFLLLTRCSIRRSHVAPSAKASILDAFEGCVPGLHLESSCRRNHLVGGLHLVADRRRPRAMTALSP